MTNQISSTIINPINSNPISFRSKESSLFKELKPKQKFYNEFIKQRENLSSARFFQDVTTNWVPKAVFTRSLADFTEMTFLEFTESALFYFVPAILNKTFRNIFSNFAPKNIRKEVAEHIAKPTEDLLYKKEFANSKIAKRAIPAKAAIVLACVSIPAGEYALSFAKNLLTLNLFKKSDFNNITNLKKGNEQKEDKTQQERVRKSANKHIAVAGSIAATALGGSFILAAFGHKSEALQKISKGILRPGMVISKGLEKLGVKKSEKLDRNLNKYINFDCDIKDGKPILSKGQLVVSTITGLFGYSAAGKDRGRLDQLEVLTRVPIVVLYTIFGSEAFDWAFKHVLHKKNKFTDLIKKDKNGSIASIPTREELPKLAEKIAKIKNTTPKAEFERLLKEKAIITSIPYGFGIVFMGFLLAGITRFWTQYRFNHSEQKPEANENKKSKSYINFEKLSKNSFSFIK